MEIIPAIDIIEGKCVRLVQGNYAEKTIYNANPLEVAKQFEAAGLQRLHLVDLDGAKAGKVVNWNVLEQIALYTKLQIDFSGGLSEDQNIQRCFDLGARFACIGSIAVKNKDRMLSWIKKFTAKKFILGADVNKEHIAIKGWTEQTNIKIMDFIKEYAVAGIEQFICTDIEKDGMLQGPSVALYKKIITTYPAIKLIASGGVRNTEDLQELNRIGCHGAIVGKAIYEGRIDLNNLSDFPKTNKI